MERTDEDVAEGTLFKASFRLVRLGLYLFLLKFEDLSAPMPPSLVSSPDACTW